MIPDEYYLLFILTCAYKLAQDDEQRYRAITDLRQEVDRLQAAGIDTLPAYVTQLLESVNNS